MIWSVCNFFFRLTNNCMLTGSLPSNPSHHYTTASYLYGYLQKTEMKSPLHIMWSIYYTQINKSLKLERVNTCTQLLPPASPNELAFLCFHQRCMADQPGQRNPFQLLSFSFAIQNSTWCFFQLQTGFSRASCYTCHKEPVCACFSHSHTNFKCDFLRGRSLTWVEWSPP